MKRAAFVLSTVLFLTACKDQKATSVPWVNICEDLTWMDSIKGVIIQNEWKAQIFLTQYQGKRVFEVNVCLACADFPTTVHDCEGNMICEFGGIAGTNTCPDYGPAVNEKLLLWKHD